MFVNPTLEEIVNKYREKKLSHAYLIETNNVEKALQDLKTLIKVLNCPEIYTSNCSKCNLCNLINKDNLPSLKIITPNGTSIKKEQIEELKENFSTIPVYSRFNVYIIKNAEKLNPSSANSMLKFLEEPSDGILGFFLTNNKDVIMDTIKSRCQSIILNYPCTSILETLNLEEENYKNYLNIAIGYLNKINRNELINHKKELLSTYSERKDIEIILKIILNIYYQNFLKVSGLKYDTSTINGYEIKEEIEKMIKKLNIIAKILQNMSYNVNIELILDRFVLEMRGSNG